MGNFLSYYSKNGSIADIEFSNEFLDLQLKFLSLTPSRYLHFDDDVIVIEKEINNKVSTHYINFEWDKLESSEQVFDYLESEYQKLVKLDNQTKSN